MLRVELTMIFTRSASEPAHNNSCDSFPKEVGRPCRRRLFLFNEVACPESCEITACLFIEIVMLVCSRNGCLPEFS